MSGAIVLLALFAEPWIYASQTSAVVYWQIGDDARDVATAGKGFVEYGPTVELGKRTADYSLPPVAKDVPAGVRAHQKPSWSQFHRITGLAPGKTYHYRLVHVSPDGKQTASKVMTFTTKTYGGTIRLPGKLAGPPYVLDKARATYVLTQDVTADGTAFQIKADNITLDLDGHKAVFGANSSQPCQGISASQRTGLRIVNGIIEQAPGQPPRPRCMQLTACKKIEIAGVTANYHGKDGQGILFNWQAGNSNIHHNEIWDAGFDTTSRHQQVNAIALARGGSGSKIHHNIILRCRQNGIGLSAAGEPKVRQGIIEIRNVDVYNNMIYQGSCMTNSMGVSASGGIKDFKIRNNRIFGRGEMPECIFAGTGARDGEIYGNYTYSQSTGKASREYGATSSLTAALRMCWGPFNLNIHDNTFITTSGVTGKFTGNARCIWAACSDSRQPEWRKSGNIDVHDNVITALVDKTNRGYSRAISVCGDHKVSAHGLQFRNNQITSNANCVVLSDSYGCGSSDVRFVNNTFIKAKNARKFVLITCGWWDKPTTGSVFVDSKFEGGTGLHEVRFDGTAKRDFSVGWTLTVKTSPGATVTITDSTGEHVFTDVADAKGLAKAELMQYCHKADGKVALTPHTVKVSQGLEQAVKKVSMDKPKQIEITLR